ncbi:MAG: pseudouridine synthase, partial [Microcoleus sp.]
MTLSKIDLVAVLSKYGINTTQKLLKVLSKATPLAHNETYYVELDGIKYRVLVDDTATNKVDYILKQFNHSQKELQGSLSAVPDGGLSLEYDGHDVYLFTEYVPVRLDTYLAKKFPEYSRSQWRKYCDAGCALVNGLAKAPKTLLKFTDKVTIELPEAVNYDDHTLPIVYEDGDVIVINKPVGTLTHAKGAVSEEFTVADFASFRTTDGLDTNRPGIVHRLDRATSGILIIAKNTEAKRHLQKQFQDRKAKKTYLAIAHNVPKNPE